MQLSPTLCRPRHLDTERLRARLGSKTFEKLRYHEAAVVSTAPMRFQLFALSSDTLFIVALTGRGEAAAEMCLPLRTISAVDRVLPANKKQRGLLLLPTSQLFRLQLREVSSKRAPSEVFFATFEPQTQLLYQLSRALRVDFQKQLMPRRDFADNVPNRIEQRLELSGLLDMLAIDLVRARDDNERIQLLDELTAAASSSGELRQLFFEDRTQVQDYNGLACYLVGQLSHPIRQGGGKTKVEFLLSIVRALGAMCFDMQLRTSCLDMLTLSELVYNLLLRSVESYTIGRETKDESIVLREDLLDAQAALLLALDAMQQHEDFRSHHDQQMRGLLVERSTSVMQQVLQASALAQWLPQFFKRLCIAISRAAIAIEQQQQESEGGEENEGETDEGYDDCSAALEPTQILALWRSVTVLDLLVKADVASGAGQVLGLLLRTRKDYIDMYLRTARFMTALSTSGILHLEDVAVKMNRFLQSLRERRRS